MAITILATSDLHLGLKFAGYPEIQQRLTEARFLCLDRMVAMANERQCALLLVAGDLFDRVSVATPDVLRAAQALRAFEGNLVAVLPGNHDYLSPAEDGLWQRFRQAAGEQVLLLDEARPYPLLHYDLPACLYPGPCRSKHSATNAVEWVKEARIDRSIRHHLGVAHGSLAGFSADFDQGYYPMSEAQLLSAGLDIWIIGHTHLRYPERPVPGDRIFLPGVPEPDGFDCQHAGGAWLLAIDDKGSIAAESLTTGSLRFLHEDVSLDSPRALGELVARHAGPEAASELVKARLSGRVTRAERAALAEAEDRLRERLLWLDWRDEEVREEITRALIDSSYPHGSFPHRLLSDLLDDPAAVELAHDLLEEARR